MNDLPQKKIKIFDPTKMLNLFKEYFLYSHVSFDHDIHFFEIIMNVQRILGHNNHENFIVF